MWYYIIVCMPATVINPNVLTTYTSSPNADLSFPAIHQTRRTIFYSYNSNYGFIWLHVGATFRNPQIQYPVYDNLVSLALTSAPLPKVSQEAHPPNSPSHTIFLWGKVEKLIFCYVMTSLPTRFPGLQGLLLTSKLHLCLIHIIGTGLRKDWCRGRAGPADLPTCPDSRRTWECEHLNWAPSPSTHHHH